eukprot:1664-Eustigmatos_ZCMA.PRE.1
MPSHGKGRRSTPITRLRHNSHMCIVEQKLPMGIRRCDVSHGVNWASQTTNSSSAAGYSGGMETYLHEYRQSRSLCGQLPFVPRLGNLARRSRLITC